jgi:ABC-type branched-subunit amino acid transport system substrate-binding protein
MRRGIELAVSESPSDAIQVLFEDDATANRVQAVNAAKKLVSIDKVDLVLNAYASSVSAIYPTLQEAGVPCIVIWDSNRALPALGKHIVGFGDSNLAGRTV